MVGPVGAFLSFISAFISIVYLDSRSLSNHRLFIQGRSGYSCCTFDR